MNTRAFSVLTGSSLILAIAALLLPDSGAAADFGPGSDRFWIQAGWFPADFSTQLRVDNKNFDIGDKIDLEDDLGLKDTASSFYGAFSWRFKPKHRLSVAYYRFDRETTAKAERELDIGGDIVPVGAKVKTGFNLQVIPISYSYSFIQSDKIEFSGSIGLHWTTPEFTISGKAFAEGVEGELTFDESRKAKASAPLPLFGLAVDYWVTPRWLLIANGQYFALSLSDKVSDYSGALTNLRAATEYVPYAGLGLGIAYNWFAMDVDVNGPDWKGRLDYQYSGPQIYATYRFK